MGAGTIYNCLLKVAHDGHHKPRNCPSRYRKSHCILGSAYSRYAPRGARACGNWGRRHSEAPRTSEGGQRGADAVQRSTGLEASAGSRARDAGRASRSRSHRARHRAGSNAPRGTKRRAVSATVHPDVHVPIVPQPPSVLRSGTCLEWCAARTKVNRVAGACRNRTYRAPFGAQTVLKTGQATRPNPLPRLSTVSLPTLRLLPRAPPGSSESPVRRHRGP